MSDEQPTADNKFNSVVKAVSSSPLFHASLPLVAAVLVATEQKWPTVKQDIAGALLLMTSFGRVVGQVMDFVRGVSNKDPQ